MAIIPVCRELICPKCGVSKILAKGRRLRWICASCKSVAAAKRYRTKNPKKPRRPCLPKGESQRRWNAVAGNHEKVLAAQAHWRKKNPGYQALWRKQNQEQCRDRFRKWRESNPDKAREATRRWFHNHPEYSVAKSARRRAQKRGVPGDCLLTKAFIIFIRTQRPPCFYCGDPATSHDHLIPLARGGQHELSNIEPCCLKHNSSKGAHTVKEFIARINFLPVFDHSGKRAFLAQEAARCR